MSEETTQQDRRDEGDAAPQRQGIEQLRARAEERDKFLDMLQRTRADFDNYQKRAARDLETERRYALTPLARDLLPALDNLDRALASVKEESTLSQGIKLVQTQLQEALKRHHIKPIEAVGKPFDPNLHEAVVQQPGPEGMPPNTVLQVLEQGYTYHDRVLRPSKVVVSK